MSFFKFCNADQGKANYLFIVTFVYVMLSHGAECALPESKSSENNTAATQHPKPPKRVTYQYHHEYCLYSICHASPKSNDQVNMMPH